MRRLFLCFGPVVDFWLVPSSRFRCHDSLRRRPRTHWNCTRNLALLHLIHSIGASSSDILGSPGFYFPSFSKWLSSTLPPRRPHLHLLPSERHQPPDLATTIAGNRIHRHANQRDCLHNVFLLERHRLSLQLAKQFHRLAPQQSRPLKAPQQWLHQFPHHARSANLPPTRSVASLHPWRPDLLLHRDQKTSLSLAEPSRLLL